MHGAVLDRESYVELLCDGVSPVYPKRTADALQELQDRGSAITPALLAHLIRTDKIKPEKRGRENFFGPELLDAMLDELAHGNCLSPLAITCTVFGLSARSFWTVASAAHQELVERFGDIAGEQFQLTDYVWCIEPIPPGQSQMTLIPSPTAIARMEKAIERRQARA